MLPIEKAAIMTFGAALAIVGIVLFARKQGQLQGTNRIKIAKFEFEVSTPSLLIFIFGCGLFVFPFFSPSTSLDDQDSMRASDGEPALTLPLTSDPASVAPVSGKTDSGLSRGAESPSVPTEVTAQRQADLEAKIAALEQRLANANTLAPQSGSGGVNAALANLPQIGGRWRSSNGSDYLIEQFGNRLMIKEITRGMISAVGEGTLDGSDLEASFQTLLGVVDVEMTLAENHQQLTGIYTQPLTGIEIPVEFHR